MRSIKNETKLGLFLFGFLLIGLFLVNEGQAAIPANNNQNPQATNYDSSLPTDSELDTAQDKVSGEMNKILTSRAQGDLSGLFFASGVKEVLPFYTTPFAKFKMSLIPDKNEPYKNGSAVTLRGKITFDSDSSNEANKFSSDCKAKYGEKNNCLSSEIYNLEKIENVGIFVQVFRRDQDKTKSKLGDYLVDEFYAAEGLRLKDKQPTDFQVIWKIPDDSKPGDYYMAFYANANKNFDLWGTPLTVFSFAQTHDFSLILQEEGKQSMGIELDKNAMSINGKEYASRLPAPTVTPDANGEVKVEVPLVNLNAGEEKVVISYQLFKWSQTDPANLLNSREESKIFSAGEKANLTYTFKPDENESVYNLKIAASGTNSRSIANVRFVMQGKNRGIFRFLGLAKSQKDNNFSPLLCVRSASWDGIFEGKVKLTLLDSRGKEGGTWAQESKIGAETRCFVPLSLSVPLQSCLKLRGEIFDGSNKLVDKEEINYPCEASSEAPGTLDNLINSVSSPTSSEGILSEKVKVLLILGGILLVLVSLAIILNNKKNKR